MVLFRNHSNRMFEVEATWAAESSRGLELHQALFGTISETKNHKKRKRKHQDEDTTANEEVVSHTSTSSSLIEAESRNRRLTKMRRVGAFDPTLEENGKHKAWKKKMKRKNRERSKQPCEAKSEGELQSLVISRSQKHSSLSSELHSKAASKLKGAHFRWINEQLYTTTGEKAKDLFDGDPELFTVYQRGFQTQASKWPVNPLDRVIAYVKALPEDKTVADFGCGEARLAQSVPHTVHSFDLVASNSCVTPCNMAHVPLANASVDVCIFCLSLMGTDTSDFIKEARRVLKQEGRLKICEIVSRFASVDAFIKALEAFGFKLVKKQLLSKMFIDLEFRLVSKSGALPLVQLKPCIYKKR